MEKENEPKAPVTESEKQEQEKVAEDIPKTGPIPKQEDPSKEENVSKKETKIPVSKPEKKAEPKISSAKAKPVAKTESITKAKPVTKAKPITKEKAATSPSEKPISTKSVIHEKNPATVVASEKVATTPPPQPKAESKELPPSTSNRRRPQSKAEKIVMIPHSELFAFKGHPFEVKMDGAMTALAESIKESGVKQPALVRPREEGGYEIVAGHRRQAASELAGTVGVPCLIRDMTDDEAIIAMTESNLTTREEILPSERSKALKMQLEAIKHQGKKLENIAPGDVGKASNEIVAERNNLSVKQVQRFIALDKLIPDLMKQHDEGMLKFTTAVELSAIKPKNQRFITSAMEAQQNPPALAQAKRMRELDQEGKLNGDVIDGIMMEEKKEEIKVILNSQDLAKYFGSEQTPKQMKEQILKALDEWKERQPTVDKPAKKQEMEK